jgi:glycopeptide antibiotics resistance protein
MVFSSYEFLVFLILVSALYAALVGLREQLGKATLILVSLVFYAYWIPGYLLILLASNVFNFGIAQGLKALRGTRAGC